MSENKYNPREIEAEAQKFWEEKKVFEVFEDPEKEKFYCLYVSISKWKITYGSCTELHHWRCNF